MKRCADQFFSPSRYLSNVTAVARRRTSGAYHMKLNAGLTVEAHKIIF